MNSDDTRAPASPESQLERDPYLMPRGAVEQRLAYCEQIARHARDMHLDATVDMVNYNFAIWRRWHNGLLATGYLMHQTGVKRIKYSLWKGDD